ncbi:MAG: hypothetical protein JNG86_05755 [Verrucomicrobiaceae bacterium]|nr:hypothetical protein [Verrucomicrobiaceae bacterium]
MKIASRITLAVLFSISLSSCQLIGSALQTAYQLLPLLLLADGNAQDANGSEAVRNRARKIHDLPAYDGRMDWMKNEKSAAQEIVAR